MRIPCPYCGEREVHEFAYLGDATVKRPDPARNDAAQAFYEYVYLRDNPAGPFQELWYHSSGCHAWIVVTRDTRTHVISEARLAAPEEAG
jgi:heterotetrameric sarcosine oxidase delta subunit